MLYHDDYVVYNGKSCSWYFHEMVCIVFVNFCIRHEHVQTSCCYWCINLTTLQCSSKSLDSLLKIEFDDNSREIAAMPVLSMTQR